VITPGGVSDRLSGPICQKVLTFLATTFLALFTSGQAFAADLPEEWPAQIEHRCETDWPAGETTTRSETALCSRYWLKRYVYGNQRIESIAIGPTMNPQWLKNGHYNGILVETVITAAQIRSMLRHLAEALPEAGMEGKIRQRASEYLQGALRARFTLSGLSGLRLGSILPELTKVFRGDRLTPEDLVCRTQMTLWKLKGAVFARHGGPVGHADLHTFFYGQRIKEVSGLHRTRQLPRRINEGFTLDQLTDVDKDNLELLNKVGKLDQQSRCRPPKSWSIAARY